MRITEFFKRCFSLSFDEHVKSAYLFLAPTIIIMVLTFAYPLSAAIIESFYRWNPMRYGSAQQFIFLQNYEQILSDPLFYKTLVNTLYLTIGGVGIEFFLGLALALLLYEDIRFGDFARTAVVVPMMMAPVLVGLIWKMFTDNEFGLFNYILRVLQFPAVNWIGDRKWILPSIIIADVWQNTSFVTLILLAGLQAIPIEQFEAAEVDGATNWQKLNHIIIPWLKPLILIVLLFRTLFIFRTFDMICMLVGSSGGIGNSAMVFGIYLYYKAFRIFDFGYASGVSVIMLILTVILSITLTIMLYRTVKI